MIFFGNFNSQNQNSGGLLSLIAGIAITGNIILEIDSGGNNKCTITYTGSYQNGKSFSFVPVVSQNSTPGMITISGDIEQQKFYFNVQCTSLDSIAVNSQILGTYITMNPGDSGVVRATRFK